MEEYKCQDRECRGKVVELEKWAWGHMGQNGANKEIRDLDGKIETVKTELEAELKKKLTFSWKWVVLIVTVLVVPAFATINDHSRKIAVVETGNKAIEKTMSEISANQREMQKDIKEILKQAIRNNGENK